MRVCLLSQADSAGQNFLLADAMRKYLGWDAKSFSLSNTYLDYPTDGIYHPGDNDIRDFAVGANLFIFQDTLFRIPGMRIDKLANKNNTIIYGLGSPMRNNLSAIMDYVKVGYHVAAPLSDPTIAQYIGGSPFEMVMIDPRITELTKNIKRNDKITICHAPTKEKGAEVFLDAVKDLDVEWMLIKGKSWEDAIKLKATAHILLDSLSDRSYGISILESLYMGQVCAGNMSNWCYALNPDLPVLKTTTKIIQETVKHAIALTENDNYKNTGIAWVTKYLPENRISLWESYIKYVME